jgi:hypothetical protein
MNVTKPKTCSDLCSRNHGCDFTQCTVLNHVDGKTHTFGKRVFFFNKFDFCKLEGGFDAGEVWCNCGIPSLLALTLAYSLRARTQGWEADHYGAVCVLYHYESWGLNMMRQVLWRP